MEAVQLVCFKCKHFRRFEGGCDAFPDGIPEEITIGNNDHSKPLPNQDNKIVFELDQDMDLVDIEES
jgi:hypothetical protein